MSDNFACLNDCLQSQRGRATLPTSFRRPSNGDSFLSPGFAASAFQFGQFEGKRRVASFGFPYDYALQTVKEVEAFGGPSARIRQVLCTGVGIGGHRDNPHFNEIISLGSACKFRLRKRAGKTWELRIRAVHLITIQCYATVHFGQVHAPAAMGPSLSARAHCDRLKGSSE